MLLALAAGSRPACMMNARVIVLLPRAGKLFPHGIMAAHFGSQEFPAVHEEQENSGGGSVGVSSPVFRDPGSNVVAFRVTRLMVRQLEKPCANAWSVSRKTL